MSLFDMVQFDIVLGVAANISDMNVSAAHFKDITRSSTQGLPLSPSPTVVSMGLMSLVVLGNPDFFAAPQNMHYSIEIQTIFTMYFISRTKRDRVLNMIADNKAFQGQDTRQWPTGTRLIPSEDLLRVCPLHLVKGLFGCMSRYEVLDRVYDFTTNAAYTAMPPRMHYNFSDAEGISANIDADWAQLREDSSEFEDKMVVNHVRTLGQYFDLNGRYRNAIVMNNDVPWRKSDIEGINATSYIQNAAHSISAVLARIATGPAGALVQTKIIVVVPSYLPHSIHALKDVPYVQVTMPTCFDKVQSAKRKHLFQFASSSLFLCLGGV